MKTYTRNSVRLLISLVMMGWGYTQAQILDSESKTTVTLDDRTIVTLYAQAGKPDRYYYLPVKPKISFKEDGTPEFLFLRYMNNDKQKEMNGAILHFLATWGLTKVQEQQLAAMIKSKYNGTLMGAADVTTDENNSLTIISASLGDEKTKLIHGGQAPVLPGTKVAVAAKINKENAQIFRATLPDQKNQSRTADLSVQFRFKYQVQFPAVKGNITIDWAKMKQKFESDFAQYYSGKEGVSWWDVAGQFTGQEVKSYFETHFTFDILQSSNVIEANYEENLSDERLDKVREAFMEVIIQLIADVRQPESDEDLVPPNDEEENEENPDIKTGNSYTFSRTKFESLFESKKTIFNLNVKLAVERSFPTAVNLTEMIDQYSQIKGCVQDILLDDPFFEYRVIPIMIDKDAAEYFKSEVNSVGVEVYKKRSDGSEYRNDTINFNSKTVEKNGGSISISYARGNDKSSTPFKYRYQWNFRGGYKYPEQPEYETGDWNGLVISAPVTFRNIEMIANPDNLKEMGIMVVILEVAYQKFGALQKKSIPLIVSEALKNGTSIASGVIFTDKDAPGYAYRFIYQREKEPNKLATEWQTNVDYNVVVVPLPEEWKDPTSERLAFAAAIAREVVSNDKLRSMIDRIINQFEK